VLAGDQQVDRAPTVEVAILILEPLSHRSW
jgi:hypothetical protein